MKDKIVHSLLAAGSSFAGKTVRIIQISLNTYITLPIAPVVTGGLQRNVP